MGSSRLGRAAVVTAALVGAVAAAAGTAEAAGPDAIALPQCLKSEVTIEDPFHQGDGMLCGGGYGKQIAVYTFDDGTRQIFYVGRDRDVWTRWTTPDGRFGGRVSLGGVVTSDPGISDFHGAFLQLKARGTDGALWYKTRYENGHWSNWFRP
ncbi:hypothetical protein [Kitasatospora sp. NPDC015120]|uniref:hypothetical protein n=1 Tax=Kitasatospora sp. NPDC015120 TaxID=3364023 RepID=UPI0036F49BB8